MVKPSESTRTLDQLVEDVFALIRRFASVSSVHDMKSFQLLTWLFKEQCVVAEDGTESTRQKAVARPNREVPSDSLQNPSDPDAGYSSHKGQGCQVQVVENYRFVANVSSFNNVLSSKGKKPTITAIKQKTSALLVAGRTKPPRNSEMTRFAGRQVDFVFSNTIYFN